MIPITPPITTGGIPITQEQGEQLADWITGLITKAHNVVKTLWNTIDNITDTFHLAALLPVGCAVAIGVLITLATLRVVKTYTPKA